jgi:hypothetical protein
MPIRNAVSSLRKLGFSLQCCDIQADFRLVFA